jgi:hypothetical protein
MAEPFSGAATPLNASDISAASNELGCDVAAIQAVLTVETGAAGGFLADGSGRPVILFEAFKFSQATNHKFDATNPTISSPASNWKLYLGGAGEYGRLQQALNLSYVAALQSTSWGLFQIMGSNSSLCGFPDVHTFVDAMASGEGAQLEAFVNFCKATGLGPLLAAHDWTHFALRYNGALYARNQYDARLAAAYKRAAGSLPIAAPLQIGASGPAVEAMQADLNKFGAGLTVDGNFGRETDYALLSFQAAHSIVPNGIAGPDTMALLSPPAEAGKTA